MSIKYFFALATLLICSCQNLKVTGNLQNKQSKTQNSVTVTYSNNILNAPVIITGKANHDPLFKDKPSYQETSIETWFW